MTKQIVILKAPDKDTLFLSKYIDQAVNEKFLPIRVFESEDEQRLYNSLKSIVDYSSKI